MRRIVSQGDQINLVLLNEVQESSLDDLWAEAPGTPSCLRSPLQLGSVPSTPWPLLGTQFSPSIK